MKKLGIVTNYNGCYGLIKTEEEIVDFAIEDLSFNEEISIGDLVEFRIETKLSNLKLARNIRIVTKKNK